MDPVNQPSEFVVEPNPLAPAPPAQRTAEQPPAEPTDRDRGASQERERINGIMVACRAARLPLSFQDGLIKDGMSLVQAQARVFEEMGRREPDAPRQSAVGVTVGDDPVLTHARRGIENAILNRVNPAAFPLEEIGREYRGMTLYDVAKAYVGASGVRTTGMSKLHIAGLALGLEGRSGGLHSTSDFANLLADVANKNLRSAYELAPQTFRPFSRQITASDFKNINLVQFGEAPALELVNEHGEFKRGTIGDAKEAFALKTYGKIFGITRQALINDDLDAFSRVPAEFGRAALQLESDLVWAQITGNPTMGDGNALFIAAHGNLETDGDVISIASLTRARKALRLQTGLDGLTYLNLASRFLVVPPSLETVAQQYVGVITPQTAAALNPFSGTMQVIAEPRLEANSATAWYTVADPAVSGVDVIVYAYLEGQSGPTIETRVSFNIDGIEIKARHDFAAKVADWRGLHKDPGELVS